MSAARTVSRGPVLARIRAANAAAGVTAAASPPAGAAPDAGRAAPPDGRSSNATADLFARRARDYGAEVAHTDPAGVGPVVSRICRAYGVRRLVLPAGLDRAWNPIGVRAVSDLPPLTAAELDRIDGAITGCAAAVAETGTVILDAGADQGRRALTLIPDLHICVIRGEQIVATVDTAIRRIAGAAAAGRPLTLVSGPSATSDIELDRVEGVHGPRRLALVLVAP